MPVASSGATTSRVSAASRIARAASSGVTASLCAVRSTTDSNGAPSRCCAVMKPSHDGSSVAWVRRGAADAARARARPPSVLPPRGGGARRRPRPRRAGRATSDASEATTTCVSSFVNGDRTLSTLYTRPSSYRSLSAKRCSSTSSAMASAVVRRRHRRARCRPARSPRRGPDSRCTRSVAAAAVRVAPRPAGRPRTRQAARR